MTTYMVVKRPVETICRSASPKETEAVAAILGSLLKGGEVICLYGGLGAGKTTFVRGLVAGTGIKQPVASPTFILVREYYGQLTLYHLDLYRLNEPGELYDIGYEEFFTPHSVVVIEWPEKAGVFLPAERLEILLERGPDQGDNERTIKARALGHRAARLIEEWKRIVYSGN